MRPFFFWSDFGDSLFLALKFQEEGARVLFYTQSPQARWVGHGLVERGSPDSIPARAIVVFDATKYGERGDKVRADGHPTIGGQKVDEKLEVDRTAGAKIMLEAGFSIPETHPFTTIGDAVDFLEDEDGKWYMKLSGDLGTDMTYNARTPEMMMRYLRWWERQPGKKVAFELQRAVEGVEVSCEGWWDGAKFVPPFNATIEDKKFGAGNVGVRTGCEANLVWILEGRRPALAAAGIARMEAFLRRHRVGPMPLDLNQIVSAAGEPFGLEYSARFGFDALPAYSRLFRGTMAEQFEAFALGELDSWDVEDAQDVSMTLRLSTAPYPTEDAGKLAAEKRGLPLDPTLAHDDRFTLTDVMLDEDRLPCLAGRDGHIGTVGQVGYSLKSLRRELLEVAGRLDIRGLYHRPDPVERAEDDMRALESHGFLSHSSLAVYLEEERVATREEEAEPESGEHEPEEERVP